MNPRPTLNDIHGFPEETFRGPFPSRIPAATIRRRARAMSRQTGAPVAECARWLEEAGGDPARAVEMMRAGST